MDNKELVDEARRAVEAAYAPYSGFPVGAALLTAKGDVYTGSNVENSSYGLSVCAERAAVFKAVNDGRKDFVALAVASDADEPPLPCGACLQVLAEFAPDMEIIAAGRNAVKQATVRDLLPSPFRIDTGS
jgi:cytidine deaminase